MAVDTLARAIAAGKTPVTAYEEAVKAGYTGTEEQFAQDMGNSGTNAANAAASASAAAASAESVSASAAQIATNTSDISDLKESFLFSTSNNKIAIKQGYWAIADGTHTSSNAWCCTENYVDKNAVLRTTNFKMFIVAYEAISGNYVGAWNGSTFSTSYNANGALTTITAKDWLNNYSNYRFKVDFYKDSVNITPSDVFLDLKLDDYVDTEANLNKEVIINSKTTAINFGQGFWAVTTGEFQSADTWCRSNNIIDDNVITIEADSPMKLYILAYENGTYIGTWFGSNFSKTFNSSYVCRFIDMTWFRQNYPHYSFRMDISGQGEITPEDCAQHIIINRSIPNENKLNISKIYGSLINKEYWENGAINGSGAKTADSNTSKRLSTINYIRVAFPITIIPKNGYNFSVATYSLDGTFEQIFSAWYKSPYTIEETDKLYMIAIKAEDNSVVYPEAIANYIETEIMRGIPFDRTLVENMNVKAVSHRGYNAIAPENTIPAFVLSSKLGYKYVECDVLFTSDGVPVVLHDETINRTARNPDGSALSEDVYIKDITYEEALTYDFGIYKGPQYAGTKIPTFAEFMYCCKIMNLHPWIELKYTHEFTLSEVQQIISIVKQYGMEEHVTFISLSYSALAMVASEWDTVELGLNGTIEGAELLKTGKNRVFMLYNSVYDFTPAINAGFQVCIYTIDGETALNNITSLGFDSVLTNSLRPSQIYNAMRYKYENT